MFSQIIAETVGFREKYLLLKLKIVKVIKKNVNRFFWTPFNNNFKLSKTVHKNVTIDGQRKREKRKTILYGANLSKHIFLQVTK